ncbi:hypothetical protein FIU97_16100 [Roseivivax sp. THAF40]|uniref:YqgE/AlgH family protein n=1 Tax=unclassified Roseivivax TaxID=2639302 RepID=UPI00126795F2|nr:MULTISPECIES: YqgE/AlgH family protein [unclassified Roseivivax]QFS84277.1 hypothetical protein FIV09_15685 [Roseivivax sp. THAF197b]QFT48105.1 hypothetical protein FIU97_16100 [Roseivivax sp. THAF40]
MPDTAQSTDLTGRILIAMPGMGDPRFDRAVVFLCSHSDEGAMGLIVNKTAPGLGIATLLEQLDIEMLTDMPFEPVFFGGPVETGRGFVLHSTEARDDPTTLTIDANFAMTATLDILEDMARGQGPAQRRMCLGYAGWGPGQLERELQQNGWLVCDADPDLIFATKAGDMWEKALGRLGVSALMLSAEGGQA